MESAPAEPIIVYTEQVPQATSTLADTRVMSPNIQSNVFGVQWWICPLCQQQARGEPAVCSRCGKWGHNVCVAIEQFQGWPVCGGCVHACCLEYSQITALGAANRQLQWNDRLNVQLTDWKSRAGEAMGQSASIGVSMGSAAATVVGAVVTGFQGFAKVPYKPQVLRWRYQINNLFHHLTDQLHYHLLRSLRYHSGKLDQHKICSLLQSTNRTHLVLFVIKGRKESIPTWGPAKGCHGRFGNNRKDRNHTWRIQLQVKRHHRQNHYRLTPLP